jgi:hypothetical protein
VTYRNGELRIAGWAVPRTLAELGQRAGADVTLREYPGIGMSQGHYLFAAAPHIWKPDFDTYRDHVLAACP